MTSDMDLSGPDICRVCRSEGLTDRPLFHPCICTGSIKWIHQECLMQWMRYSRKEYCELCGHRFSFTPIYSPDMPRRLPIRDVAGGLLNSVGTAVKYWLHYTLVALAWLGVVPLAAYRIYRCLFTGSLDSVLTLPLDILSPDNIAADVFRGCFVVTCTLFAFIGLVWLREQILHGGGPDWLELGDNNNGNVNNIPEPVAPQPNAPEFDPAIINEIHQNFHADEPINNEVPPNNAPIEEPEPEVVANGDEANWNPMEWDRAAEELTWEHLLGLDGSLVFLEHVFWVISINTLFIIVFAFVPYHIGRLVIESLGLLKPGSGLLHFNGLITTLVGYCIIGIFLIELHSAAKLLGLIRPRRILGLCYIYVKVSLLSVVEIGVLPLICGCWLDICSLPMFDASLKDRLVSFKVAPGTSMFIHWLVGMVYVYYFASFVLLLREVLRPGVLWFLRNLNDPDFSPIQEMIHMSVLRHARRLLASAVIFGTAVLLMLWVPVQVLKGIWPAFLPYAVAVHADAQINELSLELLLLQVILPALLEQSHTRIWLKALMRTWCRGVSWLLDLRSYLLGDEEANNTEAADNPAPPQPAIDPAAGLGAAHQALIHRDDPIGYQPYVRPKFFVLRMIGLLILVAISLVIASLVALTVPVWLGRHGMSLWLVGGPPNTAVATKAGTNPKVQGRVHELYTAACGMYLCWLGARAMALLASWLPQGRAAIIAKIKQWVSVGAACLLSAVLLLGVIPLLFGLLLEFVVVMPLRVPLEQTPNVFLWQDWALGVLYTKIACAITMMGPDWSLRRAIEKAYRDGIREIDIVFIIRDLAAPVITSFGLALAIPYVFAHSIAPLFITNKHTLTVITRKIYPFLLLICLIAGIIVVQVKQFKKLYEHIKNDKYLVGQRLVNYDHRRHRNQALTSSN